MKTKNYIYSFILALLLSTTHTSECMKTKKISSLIKKYTYTNLIDVLRRNYAKNIKNNIIELNNDIQMLGKQTKINFSVDNISSIGYTLYDNIIYTDNKSKKKYITLNVLFVYQQKRNVGVGTQILKTTIDILRKTFPQIEMIKWNAIPFGTFESHEAYMHAKHNLYKFYKKFGADINEETGQAVLHLKQHNNAEYEQSNF